MAHIKYVSPGGWDFDRPVAIPVKYSSRGLIGVDRQEFIKTAGHVFLPMLDTIKVAKDEVPLHLIALGAYEAYGPNRNGDAFDEATCRACHPTFVKFAKFFRNHRNKSEQGHPHFGIIKASAYNDAMRRVELLALLNAEKSACERNGGYVADVELEKLAKDGDVPLSMACRVPHDVCSWCHNQARTRDDYCTQEKCAAGGCRDNLTRLVKVGGDLHHLCVFNPNAVWFDMSRVFRGADRIAMGAKADWLDKAAADHGVFAIQDAIKMAADDTAPLEVVMYQDGTTGEWNQHLEGQIKLAYAMAKLAQQETQASESVLRAFDARLQPPLAVERLGPPGTMKCAEGLGALADCKVILTLRDFARLAGKHELTKQAALRLPGIYQRMVADGSLDRRISQNKYVLSEKLASARQRTLAHLSAASHGLDNEAIRQRASVSALRGYEPPTICTYYKEAADNTEAEQLARDYAVYKVAALERIAASDRQFPLTVRLALQQDFVQ